MSSRQRSFRLVRLRGVVAHETGTDGSYMGYGIGAGDSYGDYGGSTSSFHTVLAKPPGPPQGSPPCLLQISHSCGTQRYPKADRKPLLSRRSATPCPSRARTNDQRPRTMLRDGSREGRSPFAGVPGAEPPADLHAEQTKRNPRPASRNGSPEGQCPSGRVSGQRPDEATTKEK